MSALSPSEIEMLARVFDAHCARFGIVSKETRDSVAASLLRFYENGVRDEIELAQRVDMEDRPA